jgi:hypothetical protein
MGGFKLAKRFRFRAEGIARPSNYLGDDPQAEKPNLSAVLILPMCPLRLG